MDGDTGEEGRRASYFKPGVRLVPITGAIQGVIMVILIIYKEQRNPPVGRGGKSGTPISEQFPTAISIKPLNTSSLSN